MTKRYIYNQQYDIVVRLNIAALTHQTCRFMIVQLGGNENNANDISRYDDSFLAQNVVYLKSHCFGGLAEWQRVYLWSLASPFQRLICTLVGTALNWNSSMESFDVQTFKTSNFDVMCCTNHVVTKPAACWLLVVDISSETADG